MTEWVDFGPVPICATGQTKKFIVGSKRGDGKSLTRLVGSGSAETVKQKFAEIARDKAFYNNMKAA